MTIDIGEVTLKQLGDQFVLYLTELDEQYTVPGIPFKLPRDWLRFRLQCLGVQKVMNLTKEQAAKLYGDLQAAFPLQTVPLDGMLWVQAVPYQQPLPPVTPEYAERVWNRLREVCGPTGLTTVQLMEIMEDAAHAQTESN